MSVLSPSPVSGQAAHRERSDKVTKRCQAAAGCQHVRCGHVLPSRYPGNYRRCQLGLWLSENKPGQATYLSSPWHPSHCWTCHVNCVSGLTRDPAQNGGPGAGWDSHHVGVTEGST